MNEDNRVDLFRRKKLAPAAPSSIDWGRFALDAELLADMDFMRRVLVRGMLRQWHGASATDRERMQRIVSGAKDFSARKAGNSRATTEAAVGIAGGIGPHDWANLDEAVFGAATRLRREDGEGAGEAGERSASTSQDTGDGQHDERK